MQLFEHVCAERPIIWANSSGHSDLVMNKVRERSETVLQDLAESLARVQTLLELRLPAVPMTVILREVQVWAMHLAAQVRLLSVE